MRRARRRCWFAAVVALACTAGVASAQVPQEGLILWLDAGELSSLAPGDRISQWRDKSPLENHVSQDDADRQPTFQANALAGHPTARFGGTHLLDRDRVNGLATGDQLFHVLLVMRAPSGSSHTAQRLVDLQSRDEGAAESAQRSGFWIGYQDGRRRVRLGINQGDEGEGQAIAWDDAPHLVEAVYTGEQTFGLYQDGVRQQRAMFNGTHFLGFRPRVTLAIGQHFAMANHDATYYEGELAEVLIYSRPLTATQRFQVGTYLTEKYRLDAEFRPIPSFEKDVSPILAKHCHICHGRQTREAKLDLRTVAAMLHGGTAGPVIVRGFPDRSALIAMVESGKMPPEGETPLSDGQIRTLRDWVEADAPSNEEIGTIVAASTVSEADRAHWAYQKLVDHQPPAVETAARVSNPIDQFLLEKLEAKGLTYSVEADRKTLVRRLSFDLTGLPPNPAEVTLFVDDGEPGAYERLVDRLLASKQFGVHWARYWLDVAGYVDVYGSDNDAAIIKPLEGKWRYRDYVVDSFNQDKPFDRFLVEQLAGDELYDWRAAEEFTPEMREALTATAFLLCANDDSDQNELNTPDIRHHVLQRTTEVVASNLLAMTLMCAKCHDHKYEAIPQNDYYRLQAVFAPAFNVRHWVVSTAKGRPDVSDAEQVAIDKHNAEIDARVAALNKREADIRGEYRERLLAARFEELPETVRPAARSAVDTAADQRSDEQKKLVAQFGERLTVAPEEVDRALSEAHGLELANIVRQIAEQNAQRRGYGAIQVVYEPNAPPPTHVLRRGNYLRPGLEVQPALLAVLRDNSSPAALSTASAPNSSGRRLALARQLTRADSLAGQYVARVFVNRVWQQGFGHGIVETSDNFGVSGAAPTHPELLDWLTLRFIEEGWHVKPLIKRLVTSSAYRQESSEAGRSDRADQMDPANRLLWRMRLRRLTSEAVRDAVIATSGKLDRSLGGPPLPLHVRADGMVVIQQDGLPTPTSEWRRSAYVLARRNYHLTMLRLFDQPIVASNCTVRTHSAVVTQSLALLHDDFVLEQAEFFADRVLAASAGNSLPQHVKTAFRIALSREPDASELAWCVPFLEQHTQRYQQRGIETGEAGKKALVQLCHMLFNTNEFLYVP